MRKDLAMFLATATGLRSNAYQVTLPDDETMGLCRKFQFWGQNPKTEHRQFNDLQTTKLSKKQICDRAH
jgi:hypothetical protein